MKKISSGLGKFIKYYFLVTFGIVFPLVFFALPIGTTEEFELLIFLCDAIIVAASVCSFLLLMPIVDLVYDEGGTLLIKRRGTIIRVPISEIESVEQRFFDCRVFLKLKHTCKLGKRIVFLPVLPMSIPGILLALIKIEWIPIDQLRDRIQKSFATNEPQSIETVTTKEFCDLVTTSRLKKIREMPEEVRGWNWGACLLTWIWGIGNRSYYTFLVFIPVIGFYIMTPISGGLGNQWAWNNCEWESIEHFKETQRKWAQWGVGVWGGFFAIFGILYLAS